MTDRLINIAIHILQHVERSQPLLKEARSEEIERILGSPARWCGLGNLPCLPPNAHLLARSWLRSRWALHHFEL